MGRVEFLIGFTIGAVSKKLISRVQSLLRTARETHFLVSPPEIKPRFAGLENAGPVTMPRPLFGSAPRAPLRLP